MRAAITIGQRHDGELELIAHSEFPGSPLHKPLHEQRAAFFDLKPLKTHPKYARIEYHCEGDQAMRHSMEPENAEPVKKKKIAA